MLTRVLNLNGVEHVLTLDFNATIALTDATGLDILQIMGKLRDPEPLTQGEIAAGSVAVPVLPLAEKMRIMRRLIWAASATAHPEFDGRPETVSEVGSWFGLTDLPYVSEQMSLLLADYAQAVGKSVTRKDFPEQLAPFVPSPDMVVEAAIGAANIKPGEIVYDLGAEMAA